MAVKKRRVDMSMAVATIRVQVGELTASLSDLNDGLQALAGQIGRFGQLSQGMGPHVTPLVPVHAPPPAQSQAMAGPHSLSPHEVAQRESLLAQFPRRNRPDIERDLAEGGE